MVVNAARARPATAIGVLVALGAAIVAQPAAGLGTSPPAQAPPAAALRSQVRRESAPAPVEVVPPTGFGGYSWWAGPVREVSAELMVPTISPSSPTGHASTWVGAQSRAGGYPFIQLGVTEDSVGGGRASYHVFWSDTQAGFHPRYLRTVRAGDLVWVDMRRLPDGWALTARDLTERLSMRASVHYGAHAQYGQAEWLQEDPTGSTSAALDLPYPEMSVPKFADVKVNGAVPRLDLVNGQVLMTTEGALLVPSAMRGDGFAMAAPTGPAGQYLHDAEPLDFAINAYNFQLQSWPKLGRQARTFDVQSLVEAYASFSQRLATQAWPDRARHDVALLAQNAAEVNGALTAWEWSGLSRSSPQFARLEAVQGTALGQEVRQDLGLPLA